MSGICGVVFFDRADRVDPGHLAAMVQAIAVLGQEQESSVCTRSVALGARGFPGQIAGVRDVVVHGHPIVLAFYGSLYNRTELFPSEQADTDPVTGLLHLYLKEHMGFVSRLRGEFVLALWDESQETLYLATDRFRVHPLLYTHEDDKLSFASRMKGLLASPLLEKRTINSEAIIDIVASSVVPTPNTIFRQVKKLPPGHILICRKGEAKLTPYWEINFLQPNRANQAELARKLKVHFTDAVTVRLAEDAVPDRIGTFLSGGVDSSTVTGVISRLTNRSVKAFSVGFAEEQFNEIAYARIAAKAFGAEHHEYFVSPQDVYETIPILLDMFDEPFANASAIPTYFCAKMAREQGVEVLYAGDGGDELFAGNERYATQHLFDDYYKIPGWLREPFVKPLVFFLAEKLKWSLLVKAQKYIRRSSIPYPERLSSYGFFNVVPLVDCFEESFLATIDHKYNPYAAVNSYYFQAPAQSELDRQLYIDLKLAISDSDLFKVTRMTEAAGIVVRYPFLDHRLAEFAATVPAKIKMRGRTLRSFFKNTYADLLPQAVRNKKKHGFGLPIPVWLRTDRQLNDMMHDLVLSPRSTRRGYFRKKILEELIESHKVDKTSFYGTILWNLMVLELWHRTYA